MRNRIDELNDSTSPGGSERVKTSQRPRVTDGREREKGGWRGTVRPARLTTQALIKHIGWQLTAAAAAAATNKAAIVYTECIGHDVPPPDTRP